MSLPPPTEKQARVIWFALTTLAVALTVAILGAVLWGVGQAVRALSPVLLPLAIAAIVAFILDPVVDWLEARGIPRWRGITLVFAGALLLMLGMLGSVVPRAVVEARDLAGRLPAMVEQGRQRVEAWINHPPAPLARLLPWWHQALDPRALQTAGGWLATVVPGVLSWLAGQAGKLASALGLLVGFALVPIYVFFFLLEKQGIAAHWTEYLPVSDSRFKTELVWLVRNINDALIVFFRGQVLVALCDGVLYAVGFWLIGLPYALLLGVVASVLTI
ncbi:MAG TPA: AI-2E family transporter, partial [Verrucomicrobiota bacterium]|nr:AI-2E family transporter [Verrucomicrobiota bacterium]